MPARGNLSGKADRAACKQQVLCQRGFTSIRAVDNSEGAPASGFLLGRETQHWYCKHRKRNMTFCRSLNFRSLVVVASACAPLSDFASRLSCRKFRITKTNL